MYKAADAAFGGECARRAKKADRFLRKPLYGRVFTIKTHGDDAGSAYIPAALGKNQKGLHSASCGQIDTKVAIDMYIGNKIKLI